jgi:hypothetical protein
VPVNHTDFRQSNLQVSHHVRGPSEKFVNWQQCAAVIQKEVVTVMPSCGGGGNVIVA